MPMVVVRESKPMPLPPPMPAAIDMMEVSHQSINQSIGGRSDEVMKCRDLNPEASTTTNGELMYNTVEYHTSTV